jgi:hypothetical protein
MPKSHHYKKRRALALSKGRKKLKKNLKKAKKENRKSEMAPGVKKGAKFGVLPSAHRHPQTRATLEFDKPIYAPPKTPKIHRRYISKKEAVVITVNPSRAHSKVDVPSTLVPSLRGAPPKNARCVSPDSTLRIIAFEIGLYVSMFACFLFSSLN